MHTRFSFTDEKAAAPGLSAVTHLRSGEWRCYPQEMDKRYRQFACVNTADFELVIAAVNLRYDPIRTDLWSSVNGPTADYSRDDFYQTLDLAIPDIPENAAAYQVIRSVYPALPGR